jgi:hypothetical protein
MYTVHPDAPAEEGEGETRSLGAFPSNLLSPFLLSILPRSLLPLLPLHPQVPGAILLGVPGQPPPGPPWLAAQVRLLPAHAQIRFVMPQIRFVE